MQPDLIATKRCCTCGETKPSTGFHRSRNTADGLRKDCKECKAKRDAKYRKTPAGKASRKANSAKQEQRFPAWSNRELLRLLEVWSKQISDLLGGDFHVDHVIPRNGKKVSGLHVPENLRVTTGKANIEKSNKYTPGQDIAEPDIYTYGFAAFLAEQGYTVDQVKELYANNRYS